MQDYISLSNAVDTAIVDGNHSLADKIRPKVAANRAEARYAILLHRLDSIPKEPNNPSPRMKQCRSLTVEESREILALHRSFVAEHRRIINVTKSASARRREVDSNHRDFFNKVEKIGPIFFYPEEKIELAQQIVDWQDGGDLFYAEEMSSARSFRGGRKFSGGLPGSKR